MYANCQDEFRRLDRRHTGYRANFDSDIHWKDFCLPGRFAPREIMKDAGVRLDALESHPEALQVFHWAYALGLCELFAALEDVFVKFGDDEKFFLGDTRSLDLMMSEERVHAAMFRRCIGTLRGNLSPAVLSAYEDAFAPCRKTILRPFFSTPPESWSEPERLKNHYLFWLNATFMEEYGMYVYYRLVDDAAQGPIHSAWMELQRAHAQEETQHMVTDEKYLALLKVSEQDRADISRYYFNKIFSGWRRHFVMDSGVQTVKTLFPDLKFQEEVPFTRSEIFKAILKSKDFRRSRDAGPFLSTLKV